MQNPICSFIFSGVLLLTPLAAAVGQSIEEAPTQHKGVSLSGSRALPLGEQISAFEGYEMRLQTLVLEPGGVIALHDHKKRPGAYYVVRGEQLVEYREGKKAVVAPGTTVLETKDVEHWVINEGSEALLFVVDVVPLETFQP